LSGESNSRRTPSISTSSKTCGLCFGSLAMPERKVWWRAPASMAVAERRRSTHYVGASPRRARWPQARPRGRLPQPFPHFDVRYPRLFEDGTIIVVPHLLVEAVGVDLGVEDDPVEVAGAGLVLQRLEDAPADPVLAVGNQHGHAPDLAPATGLPIGRPTTFHEASGADGVAVHQGEHVVGGGILVVALDLRRDLLLLDEDHLADGEGRREVTRVRYRPDLDLGLCLRRHGPTCTAVRLGNPSIGAICSKSGAGSIPSASSSASEGTPVGGNPSERCSQRTASSSLRPHPPWVGRRRRSRSTRITRSASRRTGGSGA